MLDRKLNAGLVIQSGEVKIDIGQSAVEGKDKFSGATKKSIVTISGSAVAADADYTIADSGGFTGAGFKSAASEDKELYLNGMLLTLGANAGANMDYYPGTGGNQIRFEFQVEIDDVLTFVYRTQA